MRSSAGGSGGGGGGGGGSAIQTTSPAASSRHTVTQVHSNPKQQKDFPETSPVFDGGILDV